MTHPLYALGDTYIADTTAFFAKVLFLSSHYGLVMSMVIFQLLKSRHFTFTLLGQAPWKRKCVR